MLTPVQQMDSHIVLGSPFSFTGKVVVCSVFVILFLFFIFLVLFLGSKRHLMAYRLPENSHVRLVFTGVGSAASSALDPAVLKCIPITAFRSADFKEGMDCVVCLSELVDGEATRILSGCRHGFHLECIDMWFSSHSTYQVCRNSIDPKTSAATKSENVILDARKLAMGDMTMQMMETMEDVKSKTELLGTALKSLLVASKKVSAAHEQLGTALKSLLL